ncbi:hypothetical protein GQ600_8967 [Phytophthora cactorum]|nr:hypothetical protein GQ600_8967 [Phytophthora cactorum]
MFTLQLDEPRPPSPTTPTRKSQQQRTWDGLLERPWPPSTRRKCSCSVCARIFGCVNVFSELVYCYANCLLMTERNERAKD